MAFPHTAFLMQPKLKCLLAYTPNFISLLYDSWHRFCFPSYPGAVSRDGLLSPPPCAESPFAPSRCYLVGDSIYCYLNRHYPIIIAHTGSWARPKPSLCLQINSVEGLCPPQADCKSLLGDGLSRHYLCNPCVGAWTPTPRCPPGAFTRFFPRDNGLRSDVTPSAHRKIFPAMQLQQGIISQGCSHSVMFRLPRSLDPQVAPTAEV